MVIQDKDIGGKAGRLEYLHQLGQLGNSLRMQGQPDAAENVQRQINQLKNKPIK